MITHDIQELLDGTLSNQQASELLHVLSVSPEKLSAFRQHLALQTAFESDKSAITLSPAEDAAIWSALSGGAIAPPPRGASRVKIWTGGTLAIVAAGIVGYILGSRTFNLFTGAPDGAPVAAHTRAANPPSPGATLSVPPAGAATAGTRLAPAPASGTGSPAGNPVSPATNASRVSRIPSHPAGAPPSGSIRIRQSLTAVADPAPRNPRGNSPVAAYGLSNPVSIISQPHTSAAAGNRLAVTASPDQSAEPQTRYRRLPDSPHNDGMPAPETAWQFGSNGFEAGFNERVGMITPTPKGVAEADPEFSYRNVDLSYRFSDGRVGVGARAAYGTFARVSLEGRQQQSGDLGIPITVYEPKLRAQKHLWFEGFVNYRLGINDMFALGLEASAGGSSSYLKAGGDLFVVAMLNRNIGVQLGGGIGNYWYDLTAERDRIMQGDGAAGISADATTKYHGMILEGRYGLFVKF